MSLRCRLGIHSWHFTGRMHGLADLHMERACRRCGKAFWWRAGP